MAPAAITPMRSTRRATGPRRTRRPAALLLSLTVAAALGACGGDSDTSAAAPPVDAESTEVVLTIKDFAFAPANLRVPAGSVVKVVNEDDARHTATADDGSFDSSELQPGQTGEITVRGEGEVAFHCTVHDYMRGVIRVGS